MGAQGYDRWPEVDVGDLEGSFEDMAESPLDADRAGLACEEGGSQFLGPAPGHGFFLAPYFLLVTEDMARLPAAVGKLA